MSSAAAERLNDSTNKRKGKDAGDKPASKASKSVSPHDAYFDKLQKFQTDHGYIGQMVVKGISRDRCDEEDDDDHDDDEDDDDEDTTKYTKEQMESVRMILITQNRADKLDEMRSLILGDQADHGVMCFSTSFSYTVHDSIHELRHMLGKTKDVKKKLDLLMAYTFTVSEYDTWMYDNEGDMDEYTKGLAAIWKRLLKKSDQDLGVDKEYTKPALMEMLSQFKKQIHSCEGDMEFNFT